MGHFRGKYGPTDPNQNLRIGVYCFAPSGTFLSSVYSNDASVVAATLKQALEKWSRLPPKERLGEAIDQSKSASRDDSQYPQDGLVLIEYMRDLPRKPPQDPWAAGFWNKDYAWFTKQESRKFLPPSLAVGASQAVTASIVNRILARHCIDSVYSVGQPYDSKDIKRAQLTSTILNTEGNLVHLKLTGAGLLSKAGVWRITNKPEELPQPRELGADLRLLGKATYDTKARQFTQFDLLAVGTRWGGGDNGRDCDQAGGPIGFAFTLAEKRSWDRTPPYAMIWGNYWQ